MILCAFGALVKEPLLSDYDILNVHPSLLPRWRGAAPVERAMMAGDAQTGVSIMRLVAELDAGPVYAQQAEPILPTDDYASLAARLQDVSVELLAPRPGDQPGARAPARGRRHLRREAHRRGPHAGPHAARRRRTSGSSARCTRTSARASRCRPATSSASRRRRIDLDGALRAGHRPARGRPPDGLRGVPARPRRRCWLTPRLPLPVAEAAVVGLRPPGRRPRRSGRRCGPGSSGRGRPR